MHVENNVLESILNYLFGDKDTIEVHKDLQEVGVMQHLWFCQQGVGSYIKPQAPYVFIQNEAKAFV
jgi:hypothetical protein